MDKYRILDWDVIVKIINSNLRETIRVHGPINSNFIGSASKRVLCGLMGYFKQVSEQDLKDEATLAMVAVLKKEISDLEVKCARHKKVTRDLVERIKANAPHLLPSGRLQDRLPLGPGPRGQEQEQEARHGIPPVQDAPQAAP